MRQEVRLGFGECTARVKLELTDFKSIILFYCLEVEKQIKQKVNTLSSENSYEKEKSEKGE